MKTKKVEKVVEVARSYSRKVNLGNYESEDFFCSAKQEARTSEVKKTSDKLFEFCKTQVLKDMITSKMLREEVVVQPVADFKAPRRMYKKVTVNRVAKEKGRDDADHDAGLADTID